MPAVGTTSDTEAVTFSRIKPASAVPLWTLSSYQEKFDCSRYYLFWSIQNPHSRESSTSLYTDYELFRAHGKKACLLLACCCLGKTFSRCFYVHLSICMESSFPVRDITLTLDRKQPLCVCVFLLLFVCFKWDSRTTARLLNTCFTNCEFELLAYREQQEFINNLFPLVFTHSLCRKQTLAPQRSLPLPGALSFCSNSLKYTKRYSFSHPLHIMPLHYSLRK